VKSCELLLREAAAAKPFFGGFDSGIFIKKKYECGPWGGEEETVK